MKYVFNTIILLTGYFFHINQDLIGMYSLDDGVNYYGEIHKSPLNKLKNIVYFF